jgi:glutamine synthetase
VGANTAFGRTVADAHYKACLYAGINISGTNAEVMPGQWEYQVGPCTAIECGDHMWASRYLLLRCAEEYGLTVSFEPKLFSDWNGSGCHTNFSTETMRNGKLGMKYIDDMMAKFAAKHELHIALYGDNKHRLTGLHETSSIDKFSYGTGNRACSFRIPT